MARPWRILTQGDDLVGTVLIVGFGYVGRLIAQAERQRGNAVQALTRSGDGAAAAHALGVGAVAGDLDQAESLHSLCTSVDVLYYLAPPPQHGDIDTRMRNLLTRLSSPGGAPSTFVYISTTGVYGDCQGQWVTEQTPAAPRQARGRRRLDAETALHDWAEQHQCKSIILRVGGIYGPNRLPLQRLRDGEPMVDDINAPAFVNVIHAEDLAQICLAAADRGGPGEIYNVCDGHPVTMMRYFQTIAAQAGLPPPPAISMAEAPQRLSAGMLSYVQESRRIDNKKLREMLGVRLRFPNVTVGVAACLRT
jgi:nucleoside-diphosphate-sugar epimerase